MLDAPGRRGTAPDTFGLRIETMLSRKAVAFWRLVPLTIAYFVAGKFGLSLAFVNASSSAVWPPTGIAFAAFLLLGHRVWPAVLVGAYLVRRFANGRRVFERSRDVFKFTLLAASLSTAVSATVGVTTLSLGGYAE